MPIRVGLIGCGGIARYHMQCAGRDPRVSIVAYADIRAEAAHAFLAEYGGEYATGSSDELIADDTLDAVIIATRHDSHAPLATAAAEAGRHILLEKPMATTGADAMRIARAVERTGVLLTLNYKFRLEPAVRQARAAISAPQLLVVQLAMGAITEASSDAWIFDSEAGGGLAMATGTHLLDLVLWLARSTPVRVTGAAAARPGAMSPDIVAGTIEFESGAVASAILADAGENPYVSKWFCEIFDGASSAVLYERLTRVQLRQADRAPATVGVEGPPSMLLSLASAILDARELDVGPTDGVNAVLLSEALVESAASGRPMGWTDVVNRAERSGKE